MKRKRILYDNVWGIDHNEHSKEYGKLVLGGENQMPILLWKRPAAPVDAKFLSGALKHNDRVKILSRTSFRNRRWAEVEKIVEYKGEKYIQKGWLSETLLKRLGKHV